MPSTAPATETSTSPPPTPSPPALWRNVRFQTLWIGMTTSTLGVSVADIAYPLAILAITGSPARAALFAAVQIVGSVVAALPAGSLADRYDTRTIVVVAELSRAAVTALVAVALIGGWLSLPLLLTAAALLGMGASTCGTARLVLFRQVVPNEQMNRALAQDEVRTNGAAMAGPALGGALYAIRALAHAVPFLFTAASFVVSLSAAALLKALPDTPEHSATPEPAGTAEQAAAPERDSGGMLAGLRFLWDSPMLRAAMLLFLIVNTLGAGLDLVIIVLLRHQAVPSGEIGLALGIGAAGAIAGIPLIKVLHRLRPGVLLLTTCLVFLPVFGLLAIPLGPWWAAALLFTAMLAIPATKVTMDILVLRQAPAEQRGRVVAAAMVVLSIGAPAGLVGCGLLLQYLSAQAALPILTALLALGIAACATSRDLRHSRWPTPLSHNVPSITPPHPSPDHRQTRHAGNSIRYSQMIMLT